ncbi:MAG: hypothetical protein PHV74_05985 [Dehalococcoidia bacterium]|nr:hypothetical protein [Dehalococcoidia bacterium]
MARETLTKDNPSLNESLVQDRPAEQCIHHWVIDPPSGPTSKGLCKRCGEEKDFPNLLPSDKEWN